MTEEDYINLIKLNNALGDEMRKFVRLYESGMDMMGDSFHDAILGKGSSVGYTEIDGKIYKLRIDVTITEVEAE